VLRVFGHINGFGGGDEERSEFPFQPVLGVFNETNLRRYDLVLDELSQAMPLNKSPLASVPPPARKESNVWGSWHRVQGYNCR
jgi:hypothetical protein